MAHQPSEVEEELAYVKLTVLLSKDALIKLDSLKDKAGLASRGRTIQTLVEAVWDLRPDFKRIVELSSATDNPYDDAKFLVKLMIHLTNILRRLGFLLL